MHVGTKPRTPHQHLPGGERRKEKAAVDSTLKGRDRAIVNQTDILELFHKKHWGDFRKKGMKCIKVFLNA